MKKLLTSLSIVFLISSCGSSSSEIKSASSDQMNSRDKIRLKQYKVEGSKIYTAYCANCHQQDGKGLAAVFPPLAGADYLMEDLKRAACIIKNGQADEIVVNGETYNQMMPGNPITNLEIAEVLTYITNEWGNEAGLTSVKDIDKWLQKCE
ncbi:MAG: cytochrome c [Ekhidna sp.]|nr:cytochrome c [Ekhidna sp.]MBC6410874.1 cytochrome c [Ekhidna sp.]MBC6426155.1 cytochrome c [Ekhidna sp.]